MTTSVREAADSVLLASRALVGVAARSLAAIESEIPLRQYRALVVLDSHGAQNAGVLADALDIHASTATRLCDRLIAKELIARTPSADSRREVTVALTARGRAVVRSVTSKRRTEIQRILDRMPQDARVALSDAFSAFAEAAGEIPDDAWRLGWTP